MFQLLLLWWLEYSLIHRTSGPFVLIQHHVGCNKEGSSRRMISIIHSLNYRPQEVERSNFWIEVPRIWNRFWLAFVLCFAAIVGMIVLSTPAVPPEWGIPGTSWAVIVPLA